MKKLADSLIGLLNTQSLWQEDMKAFPFHFFKIKINALGYKACFSIFIDWRFQFQKYNELNHCFFFLFFFFYKKLLLTKDQRCFGLFFPLNVKKNLCPQQHKLNVLTHLHLELQQNKLNSHDCAQKINTICSV